MEKEKVTSSSGGVTSDSVNGSGSGGSKEKDTIKDKNKEIGSGLSADGTMSARVPAAETEKLISMSPGKIVDGKDSVRRQQQQQLKKPAAAAEPAGIEFGTAGSGVVKDGQVFIDRQGIGDLTGWMHRPCAYSRTFYSTVPGISPLRRGANAAVYFKKPTGYTDLPGGVTAWSVLVLILVGCCVVGQLCCLRSQCKAYGYGAGAKKAARGGHLL